MVCKHKFINIAQASYFAAANWSGGTSGGSPAVLQCEKCLGVFMVNTKGDFIEPMTVREDKKRRKLFPT